MAQLWNKVVSFLLAPPSTFQEDESSRIRSINPGKLTLSLVTQLENSLTSFLLPPGKILTDDFADKEGLEMGDEYFANLDHIESVENFKEGYESDAKCSSDSSGVDIKDGEEENTGTEEQEESNEDSSDDNFCKDEDFGAGSVWRSYATRRQTRGQRDNGLSETASKDSGLARHVSHEEAAAACKLPVSEDTPKNKVASWLSSNNVADGFQDNDGAASFRMSEGGENKGGKAELPGEREKIPVPAAGDAHGESKALKKEVRGGCGAGRGRGWGNRWGNAPRGTGRAGELASHGAVGTTGVWGALPRKICSKNEGFYPPAFLPSQEPDEPTKLPG